MNKTPETYIWQWGLYCSVFIFIFIFSACLFFFLPWHCHFVFDSIFFYILGLCFVFFANIKNTNRLCSNLSNSILYWEHDSTMWQKHEEWRLQVRISVNQKTCNMCNFHNQIIIYYQCPNPCAATNMPRKLNLSSTIDWLLLVQTWFKYASPVNVKILSGSSDVKCWNMALSDNFDLWI